MLATGPTLPGPAAGIGVTLDAHPAARCAVTTTATIVAYDTIAQRDVAYRFVRSDGTVSPTGHLAYAGDGAVAQSVRDTWTPRGTSPWIALEVVSPQRTRSPRHAVTQRCPRRLLAATH
jgi:Uma2 family endonuclease